MAAQAFAGASYAFLRERPRHIGFLQTATYAPTADALRLPWVRWQRFRLTCLHDPWYPFNSPIQVIAFVVAQRRVPAEAVSIRNPSTVFAGGSSSFQGFPAQTGTLVEMSNRLSALSP